MNEAQSSAYTLYFSARDPPDLSMLATLLSGGYGWRLFFYVEIAFAGFLLILAFLFVEETAYK